MSAAWLPCVEPPVEKPAQSAGVEAFFREVATPARSFGLPPADEPVPDRETLIEIMSRHGQTVLGPPLPPKA